MTEQNDYARLRKRMPQPFDRLDRVENPIVSGMPDTNFCAEGQELWIEQKSPIEPMRPTTPLFGSNHRVSQDQMNWHLRQHQAGGISWLLITTDKRWILIGGYLINSAINTSTVGELIEQSAWTAEKPIRDQEQWEWLRDALISSPRRGER